MVFADEEKLAAFCACGSLDHGQLFMSLDDVHETDGLLYVQFSATSDTYKLKDRIRNALSAFRREPIACSFWLSESDCRRVAEWLNKQADKYTPWKPGGMTLSEVRKEMEQESK